ncbi:hypothetical protein [Pseudohongiella sp.]|uniref:Uncharacterized protein n=1 Tax=marine sediment metagenome TaxID=412755 RepID=A0A0F9YQL5_9ZZZZ|nr:hypothetical protein [Pseudohongiella sp.]HDZ10247.1 hypothetical protein [Pseudohongiella sp.]HEA64227.1 hypothetical protein [Pseudohongiella sp.]
MKNNDHNKVARRRLLTGMSVAAVAGLAVSAGPAQAQPATEGFQPARHDKDAWLNELSGSHRVFIDSSTMAGGPAGLWYANNMISAHEEEYDGEASDFAMVVCFRHMSTPYGFDDGIWAKYGTIFNRNADPAPTRNPLSTPSASNGQNSIASSVARGVHFAICGRATRRFAMAIASATGGNADTVFAELTAGAVPNSHFVPAGVLTATRAQEYRYSFLYAE